MPKQFNRDQRGQSMVEYGIALALVSAVAFGAFQTLGQKTSSTIGSNPITTIGDVQYKKDPVTQYTPQPTDPLPPATR